MSAPQGLGGQAAAAPGDPGRVAQGPSHVAVPGAHFQLSRHYVSDARGREAILNCGQNVERHNEKCPTGR